MATATVVPATVPSITTEPVVDRAGATGSSSRSRLGPIWAVPAAMAVVFALTVIGMYWFNADLTGAIGLGVYLAFWLGGGFGAIVAGVAWAGSVDESGGY